MPPSLAAPLKTLRGTMSSRGTAEETDPGLLGTEEGEWNSGRSHPAELRVININLPVSPSATTPDSARVERRQKVGPGSDPDIELLYGWIGANYSVLPSRTKGHGGSKVSKAPQGTAVTPTIITKPWAAVSPPSTPKVSAQLQSSPVGLDDVIMMPSGCPHVMSNGTRGGPASAAPGVWVPCPSGGSIYLGRLSAQRTTVPGL